MDYKHLIEVIGTGIEVVGIAVILIGLVIVSVRYVRQARGDDAIPAYTDYRRGIARSVVLGLEFLVAGDIIRTVSVDLTFRSLGLLAIIVLIRSFLSLELDMEIEGRWPWQTRSDTSRTERDMEGQARP